MAAGFRSIVVKEVKEEILDEFYKASVEFTSFPLDLGNPRFLTLLQKALAVANEVSSVNRRAREEARTVDAMIHVAGVSASRANEEMQIEKALLASVEAKSCLSAALGLVDAVLIVGGERISLKSDIGDFRKTVFEKLLQRRAMFGLSKPLSPP